MVKLGVSSCLIGNHCRYDGENSIDSYVAQELSKEFLLIPYCPEDDIFGTPRETISLKEFNGVVKVITNFTHQDVTKKLQESIENIIVSIEKEQLSGYVFKSKSPSCGVENVKVFQEFEDSYERKGVGLMVKIVQKRFPDFPIIEENSFLEKLKKEEFLDKIKLYAKRYQK